MSELTVVVSAYDTFWLMNFMHQAFYFDLKSVFVLHIYIF